MAQGTVVTDLSLFLVIIRGLSAVFVRLEFALEGMFTMLLCVRLEFFLKDTGGESSQLRGVLSSGFL